MLQTNNLVGVAQNDRSSVHPTFFLGVLSEAKMRSQRMLDTKQDLEGVILTFRREPQ